MWTDETIFSDGDLLSGMNYAWFIVERYGYCEMPFNERYHHVLEMIKRLEAERAELERMMRRSEDDQGV